ncbi:MAG: helix-turn-helix transcriptional regulator [Clostridia bacterium]|nr:helix-turn-helix transcriptional regulator [Clostridia bacterium]
MKKFNNNLNVLGLVLKTHREKNGFTKEALSRSLELFGIILDRNEIYRIEHFRRSVKDFELIAICKILKIDFNDLIRLISED